MPAATPPSTTQVNKAGEALRSFFFTDRDNRDADALDRVSAALDVLTVWRAAHASPLQDFGTDVKRAMTEYARLEREHLKNADSMEIVLIGSDSLDTVKITHANYFDGTVAVSKYFAGI